MRTREIKKLLGQILWDYNISEEEVENVLKGEARLAGHYTRDALFCKLLESYPWFTIIRLFTPQEIKDMLSDDIIKRLRSPSLRQKYEFVKERLQEIIPDTG